MTELPAAIKSSDIEKKLEEVGSPLKAMTGGAGSVKKEKKLTVDGNPGFESVLEIPQQGAVTLRAIIVKQRLYTLLAGPFDRASAGTGEKFFNSFKLLK